MCRRIDRWPVSPTPLAADFLCARKRLWPLRLLMLVCWFGVGTAGRAATITVAAAADLRFALDEIVAAFEAGSREDRVEVVFGSSGKLQTQIQQGAPYDLFFSADIEFPRRLAAAGLAASAVRPYSLGRIVLWSASLDATQMTLASLTAPAITRIAIANPCLLYTSPSPRD